jgi:hypothetical protein
VDISYSTFSGNSANIGGGIEISVGTLNVANSILADNTPGNNCNGTINDGGHNLEDADTCGFSGDSLFDTDPLLAPLDDNGGPTWTHALMQGSPAIDSADPANCPSTDQRGAPRPFDGDGDGAAVCDRGSFEAGYRFATTTSITGETLDPSYANQPFTVTFAVSSTFGTPSGDVFVMASDSEGGCSDELNDGFGSCQLTLSAAGTYTVTAAYFGNDIYSPSSDSVLHDVIQLKIFLPLTIRSEQP